MLAGNFAATHTVGAILFIVGSTRHYLLKKSSTRHQGDCFFNNETSDFSPPKEATAGLLQMSL
jgi:hypothetical protein